MYKINISFKKEGGGGGGGGKLGEWGGGGGGGASHARELRELFVYHWLEKLNIINA